MRAAEPIGPIDDAELPALFAPVEPAALIALAVSGGADSLALLDCADRWRRRNPGAPSLLVLTVDHGLRASSRKEAARVVATARSRGLEARMLRWTGKKPKGDIEAAARAARYHLLLSAAREAGASHLLLAHHRDDQAETLLLRLARGSGLFGLAAMRSEIRVGEVTIVRPFLGVPRSRLRASAAAAGLAPVEDAMNADPRFARARIRQAMPSLALQGIDAAGLAATARRLAGAAEAIDAGAGELLARAVAVDELATAAVDPVLFFRAPAELRARGLVRLLLAIGGDQYPPRYDRLLALLRDMEAHRGTARFKRTLAGVVIEVRGGRFLLYREIGRDGLPEIRLSPGSSVVWDGRFRVEAASGTRRLRLAALGEEGRRAAGLRLDLTPTGVIAALPALWSGATLVAVPTIGYFPGVSGDPGVAVRSILSDRLAEPPRFPDFLAPA